jgi:homoserine dehydrogenase
MAAKRHKTEEIVTTNRAGFTRGHFVEVMRSRLAASRLAYSASVGGMLPMAPEDGGR